MRGTHGAPEAGTRAQYVQCVMPWGQAALRLRYVHNAGRWHAVRPLRRRRALLADTCPLKGAHDGELEGGLGLTLTLTLTLAHASTQARTTGSWRERPPARTVSSVTPTMELQSAPW